MLPRILTYPGHILLPVTILAGLLGTWQLQRMEGKRDLINQFNHAEQLDLDEALKSADQFVRVKARGVFDETRHILLDNKIFRGRAGVQVLTPFTSQNNITILVNRGWQPLVPDRSALPEFETPGQMVDIAGILAPPPENRQMLGEPDELSSENWPQLVTYLEIDPVAQALGVSLPQRIWWLDAADGAGFDGRDWSPTTMTPEKHQAYAVQWFGLALAAFSFWSVLMWKLRKAND